MKGYLLLEDGTVYEGTSFGAPGVSGGEVVFNTAMTGYQEILTDPSYSGQIVTMTYPLIGSYGVNDDDIESRKIFSSGFVVREYVSHYSNWRATKSLGAYLNEQGIVGIEGVDTRTITRRIREHGSLRGLIATGDEKLELLRQRLKEVPSMVGQDLASRVAVTEPYTWNQNSKGEVTRDFPLRAVVVDCGVKYNILRSLVDCGAAVTVVPPSTSAKDILKLGADVLLVSNGPGDPEAVKGLVSTLRDLIGKLPIFGICLGHQLLALAVGAKTYKLKFGHHGANHPVRDERTGKIQITSQNHGFAVDGESLTKIDKKTFGKVIVSHVHLSDGTIEGFELPDVNVKAIQYHPEASPGPHDAAYLFEEFLECKKKRSSA